VNSDPWFPIDFALTDGARLGRCIHAGKDWQIYPTGRDTRVLIAEKQLRDRWVGSRLIGASGLTEFAFGKAEYAWLPSGAGQRLEPVWDCPSPNTKADALAFAVALKETRKLDPVGALHDAIYVERLSRLFPTWSVSEYANDGEVLGRWLTGGVSVPVRAFRRLSSLLGWLSTKDVTAIVDASGVQNESNRDSPSEVSAKSPQKSGASKSPPRTADREPEVSTAKKQFYLAGRPKLQAFFNEHVIDIIENAERYASFGVEFPGATVLWGPPGCGKTFAVERLVEYLDWPIFHVDSNSVGSPYIHETSKKVGQIFDKAIDAAPSVIVIDEMESYLSDRQSHGTAGLHHVEEVAEFLRRIPEANKRHVLVVGMTNRLEMIDSAILRRGRFDHVIEVDMPNAIEVTELIQSLLEKLPVAGSLDIDELVQSLTGRPLSDVAFVVREAARLAARSGKSAVDDISLRDAQAGLPAAAAKRRTVGFVQD
jgi:hypothetical protein